MTYDGKQRSQRKQLTDRRREQGLCLSCGASPISGLTSCQKCRDANKLTKERQKERAREREREQYSQRKEQGLCVICGHVDSSLYNSTLLCEDCWWKRRTHIKNRAEERHAYDKAYRASYKQAAIERYGGGCNCCGVQELAFLTIDHVNSDGSTHRQETGLTGDKMYRFLINNPKSDDYQVLCWNCNLAKHIEGQCPHATV